MKNFKKSAQHSLKNGTAFTMIELLIVIAITLLVVGAAIPIYSNLQSQSQSNSAADQLIQTIRTARERSVARFNNARHGVCFGTSTYVLYQGDSYTSRASDYDRSTKIEPSIVVTLPESFTNNEINFSLSLGIPSATGTIVVNHEVNGSNNIILNDNGKTEIQ